MRPPKNTIRYHPLSSFPDHHELLAALGDASLPTICWNAQPHRSSGRRIRERKNRELAAALTAACAYIAVFSSLLRRRSQTPGYAKSSRALREQPRQTLRRRQASERY